MALLTIPATVYLMHLATEAAAPTPGNANFITRDERSALNYLARDPQPGAVVTRYYLGTAVPGQTGRSTFVGDCLWSEPDCMARAYQIQLIVQRGALAGHRAGARPLDRRPVPPRRLHCGADPWQTLAPITVSVKHFGCASVYVLDRRGNRRGL